MSQGTERSAESPPAVGNGPRLRSVTKMAVFDVVGPFAAYSLLHAAGMSAVTALILSGVFPAIGVAASVIQHRRLEVIGALVLSGIIVGALLGLVSHNARLVLAEGSVPTAVFGLACLGSLLTSRPLMFGFALEFTGPDTAKGREMTDLWQYPEFQHIFRVITAVWGIGFLIEAGIRLVIIEHTSTSTALITSKVTPFLVAAILCAWTVGYGAQQRRKGERQSAATSEPPEAEEVEEVEGIAPSSN